MGSIRTVVFGLLILAACGSPGQILPGEGITGPSCAQLIPRCDARRLENVVLRGGETDGLMFAVDGLDAGGLIGFDEALEHNGYLGGGETVQVILGAADADQVRWGTGTNLYYAIRWTGTCGFGDAGPGEYEPGPCDATVSTVVDARTGEFVVGGSSR